MSPNQYRRLLDTISRHLLAQVISLVKAVWRANPLPFGPNVTKDDLAAVRDKRRQQLAEPLAGLIRGHRSQAHSAALQYLDAEAADHRGPGPVYHPSLPGYPDQAVQTALQDLEDRMGTLSGSLQAAVAQIGAMSVRHTEAAARQAVSDSTDPPDDYQGWHPVAWARMLTGPKSCGFCMVLASRGAVYASEADASVVTQAQHRKRKTSQALGKAYHDHCDCVAVPVYEPDDWKGKQAADKLHDIYADLTDRQPGHAVDLPSLVKAFDQEAKDHPERFDFLPDLHKAPVADEEVASTDTGMFKMLGRLDFKGEQERPRETKLIDFDSERKTYPDLDSLTGEQLKDLLKAETGMDIHQTGRTRVSDLAVKEMIRTVGQIKGIYDRLPEKVPYLTVVPKTKAGREVAGYQSDKALSPLWLEVNEKFFADSFALKALVDREVYTQWFSKNASSNHVMLHELAHHVDFQLTRLEDGQKFSDIVFNEMEKADPDFDPYGISGYAGSEEARRMGTTEAFAEYFAEAYGPTPGHEAVEFKRLFERLASEVFTR